MVAAAIIGSAVIGAGVTAWGADQASDANQYGADTAAAATVEATRLQVEEMTRQFDIQMELIGPMLEAQYGAMQFFAETLGFGGWNAETGEWDGGGPDSVGFGAEGGFQDPNLDPSRYGTEDWREGAYGETVLNSADG